MRTRHGVLSQLHESARHAVPVEASARAPLSARATRKENATGSTDGAWAVRSPLASTIASQAIRHVNAASRQRQPVSQRAAHPLEVDASARLNTLGAGIRARGERPDEVQAQTSVSAMIPNLIEHVRKCSFPMPR